MDESTIQRHSGGWLFYVKAAFGISLGLMILGIVWLPTDLWIKGYLVMGIMFVVGSTITLAKTLRDDHEARRLINRISQQAISSEMSSRCSRMSVTRCSRWLFIVSAALAPSNGDT